MQSATLYLSVFCLVIFMAKEAVGSLPGVEVNSIKSTYVLENESIPS